MVFLSQLIVRLESLVYQVIMELPEVCLVSNRLKLGDDVEF